MAYAFSRTIMPQNDQDKVFPDIDDVYHIDNKTINQIVDNAWINTNQACITKDSLDTWMMENKKIILYI